jgi:hypothetical protein
VQLAVFGVQSRESPRGKKDEAVEPRGAKNDRHY